MSILDHEDRTDLGSAGDPAPTRPLTRTEQNAAVRREVNRAGPPKPQPQGGKGESQKEPPRGESPRGATSSETSQQDPLPASLMSVQQQPRGNPLNGQDWFGHLKDDPEAMYYALQEAASLVSAAFGVGGPDFSPRNHISRTQARAKAVGTRE